MHINSAVSAFAMHMRKLGHSPYTIESYSRDATSFLEWCHSASIDIGDVSPETLSHYTDSQSRLHNNSVRRQILGIRKFFRFLHETGELEFSPTDSAFVPARLPVKSKTISSQAFQKLVAVTQRSSHPLKSSRDLALVYLLGLEGLKVSELITLKWTEYLAMEGLATLKVVSPQAERIIRLNSSTSAALNTYRSHWRQLRTELKWSADSKIFVSYRGKGLSRPIPNISRHGVKHALYELGEAAGLKTLNSESLRHHAIENMLDCGKNPEDIKDHLGLKRLGLIGQHVSAKSKELRHDRFRL